MFLSRNAPGVPRRALARVDRACQRAEAWQRLRTVLADAPRKLTRPEICRDWPGGKVQDPRAMVRWLERAVAAGLLCKDGQGVRCNPFRYWLPDQEARWRLDPLAYLHMPELRDPPPPLPPEPTRT